MESAIDLAFNPHNNHTLQSQAVDFLNRLRADHTSWQICLSIFTRTQPPPSEVVRIVCLEVVNNAVQMGKLEQYSLQFIKNSLLGYVRHKYSEDNAAGSDSAAIQNKLTQTFTYLFTSLYASEWTSFFNDFKSIAGEDSGSSHTYGKLLYLRILGSIHDEIADVLIPRTPEEQKRSGELKDLIRTRDVSQIALTWQEILSKWRQIDLAVVELCLTTIAKWVSWIDISIVIDRTIQNALLELAGQQGDFSSDSSEARARDAAIDTFTETVGKKMGAEDKIELIRYLNLSEIVKQLISSRALAELRTTSSYDTDLAETVAKLVNNVVFDLVKALDVDGVNDQTRAQANQLLQVFITYLLRFFADEYDEICSAVIPSLTDLLTLFRRQVKSHGFLATEHSGMLRPILDAIIAKMKYDETAIWGEEDEATDEAEFQELRKRLYVLQQTVAAVDEGLYIAVLSQVVADTFSRLNPSAGDSKPDWRDLDLAMHEMYLFGELAVKNGGLYQKSTPSSVASERLLDMMAAMVDAGLAAHPHPAIQLQFMEICVRYVQFFEHNPASIPKVLETFVGFVHSEHPKVRLRSWYLFQRFVRHLRAQLGNVALDVARAVGDLLVIKAETPVESDEEDDSSEGNGHSNDAVFTSQLYLFEAIGCVASTAAVSIETKVAIAKSVVKPLSSELQQHLAMAKSGDPRANLQIRHVVRAIGTFANGFSDWTPGAPAGGPPPNEVGVEFVMASEGILLALEALKQDSEMRTASRHAFSRLLGVLGSNILPQLARWIDGLLSSASSNDEMAMFLRTLAQVVYGFKSEIFSILDTLLSPLFQRVFAGLSSQTSGTDDEIQLRELRQQFLNFVLVILNNDLGGVLVSPANQGLFSSFIATVSRSAVDPTDPQSARLALSALSRMCTLWGGPDITNFANDSPTPTLPGFDSFIMSEFAPIPWRLISSQAFNAGDAQMRSVVQEAGALQWTILRKGGSQYQQQLEQELRSLGAANDAIRSYFESIGGDVVGFRKFFAGFIQQAKR